MTVEPETTLPRLTASFIVRGPDLDPELVTHELGLVPSLTWTRGQRPDHSDLEWKDHGWLLRVGPTKGHDVSEVLDVLLRSVAPIAPSIARVRRGPATEVVVRACIQVEHLTPQISLKPSTLERIARLDANLEIDLILARRSEATDA